MEPQTTFNPVPLIAAELHVAERQVDSVVKLLGDGNTVPFIARYRKEMTGTLDETQIRTIEERHAYLVELDKRRLAILESIEQQGKLTKELKVKIDACTTKAALEDLYLPYKPKRRTRATIAKEKGLEPLGLRILAQPQDGNPQSEAQTFVSEEKGVADVAAALAGARDIAAEAVAENADVRAMVRETFLSSGTLVSEATGKADDTSKFKDYYGFKEPVATIPSHRFLAVRRGEREEALKLRITVDDKTLVEQILTKVCHRAGTPFADELVQAVQDSFERLIAPSVESEVRIELKLRADRAAVDIFASNMRNLLLAAPYGTKSTIGVDPGLRTGCKCAAVDATGKFLGNMVFNIVRGDAAAESGKRELALFVQRYGAQAVAVGNGTGGRETEKFVRETLAESEMRELVVVPVSEAGASVYSASELAAKEFPELDVTVRGAISIARRLQDPLAELVKIDPKSIGVGQYQHDVHQPLLARKLDEVVESCVNHVGVELNTASAPLLSRVAGIGPALAQNIVSHREANGAFKSRKELLKVSKLGPRTFEQAAGFLRLRASANPLDASAVHPERYELVARIASDMSVPLQQLVGDPALASSIDIKRYVSAEVGEPTLRDIVEELKKPGRDPRQSFEPPAFRDDVQSLEDLRAGMALEGIVTNVTAFGAFVDVGVHQDGLVHISQLSEKFVKDPAEVVKVGDKIKVRVLDVDLPRKRISLSAKPELTAAAGEARPSGGGPRPGDRSNSARGKTEPQPRPAKFAYNPFADLWKKN